MRARGGRNRLAAAVLASQLTGCVEVVHSPEVSREEIQRAAQAVGEAGRDGPGAELRARDGRSYHVDRASSVEVTAGPEGKTTQTTLPLGELARSCDRNEAGRPAAMNRLCPETGDVRYRLEVPRSVPNWRAIAGTVLVAGAVAADVGCLAKCGEPGRDVVIGADVALAAVLVVGVVWFVSVLGAGTRGD